MLIKIILTFFITINLFAEPLVTKSPKKPWNDLEKINQIEKNQFNKILFWVPNRLLDLIDIFKIDIGAGFSHGAVLRLSQEAQIGYRDFDPSSLRLGLLGRRSPILLESSKEYGFVTNYKSSQQRNVCQAEIGAGLDLYIFGAYLGFCPDETLDFFGGIVNYDFKDDDL